MNISRSRSPAALVAQTIAETFSVQKRIGDHWLSKMSVQVIAIFVGIAVVTPCESLLACACSEVVVAQGNTTSSFSVDDQTAEFYLTQSDIELPGVVPVRLLRKYGSSNQTLSVFGFGWGLEAISYVIEIGESSAIHMGGRRIYFPADNNNYSVNNDYRLVFSGEDEITMEDLRGAKWVYDTEAKTLKEAIDQYGNVTTYEWKVETVEYWNKMNIVYCPTSITFPGNRELVFTYSTEEGREYLCTKVASPSGFDVEYEYTDGLLTAVSKSNGQVLDYSYHTVVHSSNSAWVVGWLTKIIYSNGGEIEITYNGQYASPDSTLRVTKIEGPEGYEREFEFEKLSSPDGRRLTVMNSLQQETVYENYTSPRKTLLINALNETVVDVLNEDRLVTTSTDARGNATSYTYNTSGTNQFSRNNLLTRTNALNKTWTYGYNANNVLNTTTDPLAHSSHFVSDNHGNLLSGTNAINEVTVVNTYTTGTGPKGLLASTADGQGNLKSYEYNGFGLATKIVDEAAQEWAFEYAIDGSSNMTKVINPLGKEWRNLYNGFYKVSKTIDPLGNETLFEYDEMANLSKVIDGEGNERSITYDQLQRVTSISNSISGTTRFTYDSESNPVKLTDALNREYTYTFDAVNRTKTFIFPDLSQEAYDYDANGNLTKLTRRNGGDITFVYDAIDRNTSKTWEEATDTVFTIAYDDADRMVSLIKATGTNVTSSVGLGYNPANQLTTVTTESGTVAYAYDSAQRCREIVYPSGETVKYGYNSRSLLTSIKNGSNIAVADFLYDDASRLTKKTLPNGLECLYEYNDSNWLTRITLKKSGTSGEVLQDFQYGYNGVGNRTWVKFADGNGDVYDYDATHQLTGVKYGVSNPEVGFASAIGAIRSVTYSYDEVGNRTHFVDTGTEGYAVNNLNQYTSVGLNTSWSYDENGNLIGDGTWSYNFDSEGHLINASTSGTSAIYNYDAAGRRLGKNVNGTVTKYVYSGQNLIEERDASDSIVAQYIYTLGIDNPVMLIKSGTTYYFHQDAVGNVTALTDESGEICEAYSYDAFGKPKIVDGDGAALLVPMQPFLFTGREYDSESGLYHYRTRAYSPRLERFLQPDQINFNGGDVNLYRYVSNNPIIYKDPHGLCAENPNTPSVQDLGIEGSLDALNESNKDPEKREFCGMICEKCVGGLKERFRTGPVPGNRKQCFPHVGAPCPSGSKTVGAYHNHPSHDRGPISPQDMDFSRTLTRMNGQVCPVFMGREPTSSSSRTEVSVTTGGPGRAVP